MKRAFHVRPPGGAEVLEVAVEGRGRRLRVESGGRVFEVEVISRSNGASVVLFADGLVMRGRLARERKATELFSRGKRVRFEITNPREEASAGAPQGGAGEVAAPMPGRIVEVRASPGQAVAAGDVLLILEAMKMQNELRAEGDGVVEAVGCKAGDAVEAGAVLVRFRGADND